MQIVGHLVGVDADQAGLDLVDGPVERVDGDIAQLLREYGLQLGKEMAPEGPAAAHQVFPRARLALVDAGGSAATQRCALEGWVDALLVHGVAQFVQSREQAVAQVVGRKARGDAHVARGEPDGEWMVSFVLPAALQIVAVALHDVQPKGLLQRFGVVPVQK